MTNDELLTKNMELAGVIRSLRANAREDAERIERLERNRDEAREENKKLREALIRVRTWGIESKNFSSNDNGKMAHWIDGGCAGELPEPDGPWIYQKMEASK